MGHNVVYNEQTLPIPLHHLQSVTTVLICHNVLLRTGISQILSGTRFNVTEQISDDLSGLSALPDGMPVLFLICGARSDAEYAQTVKDLKARYPAARVVVLADTMDPRALLRICQEGLSGFCPTTMDRHAIVKALELVMLGETFIPGSIGLSLLDQVRGSHILGSGQSVGLPSINNSTIPTSKLSEREAQILHCLTHGASNKLIARELGVAEATVKVHVKAILRKVKAANRTQAAMWAAGHLASLQENGSPVSSD